MIERIIEYSARNRFLVLLLVFAGGLGVAAFHLLPGLLVGLTFQLTHISEGNAFPSINSDGRLHTSRALHTVSAPSVTCKATRITISVAGRTSSGRRRW